MPVSKRKKAYYTKEQYRIAKYECSALEYALQKGYPLVKEGKYYHMKGHDSMIFASNGMWYWNSRGIQGKALDFMVVYEGKTAREAILELTEGQIFLEEPKASPSKPQSQPPTQEAVFALPKKSGSTKRLCAYLCGKRSLKRGVVSELLDRELLYEGIYEAKGRQYHNAVFVYYDPAGKAVGAFMRGVGDVPYKREVAGSDKSYGWLLCGSQTPPTQVYVFEAAIDAISQRCLAGEADEVDRLSLEGLASTPLLNYLSRNPTVTRVTLMLDNDKAGRRAAQSFAARLSPHITVNTVLPPQGKDWNEALCIIERGDEVK